MEDILFLDKDTLLVYLINELSPNVSYKVTIILDNNGCWTPKINIATSQNEPTDVGEYYKRIAESF